jgi:glycosyltransferase involved in cell wall biosynthesis
MKITLCLLTHNELNGCKHDIPLIPFDSFDEIFAVDGNSNDGTVEYLQNMGITVFQQPRPSLSAACTYAFEKCTTDALIFFHPKGTVPVNDTLKFLPMFEQGFDLIIASRCIAGSRNEEDDKYIKPRKWFTKFMALIASILFRSEGPLIWDVLHGFRAMKVEAFKLLNPSDHGVSIDLEMVCRSYKHKLKITEFPTIEKPRISGKTHFKALPTGWALLKYIVHEILRYN